MSRGLVRSRNPQAKLLVAMVLTIVLLPAIVSPAKADQPFNPGVFPGQWAKYASISANWYHQRNASVPMPPTISDLYAVNWTTITVLAVQGTNVTASHVRSYSNGTITETLWADIQAGGNLTNWIIAGNLTGGSEIYPGGGELNYPSVNRTYLGVLRTVNLLFKQAVSIQNVGNNTGTVNTMLNAYYDQVSGVLVELHYTYDLTIGICPGSGCAHVAYGNADLYITDSNIFGTTHPPDFYLYTSPNPLIAALGSNGSTLLFPVSENQFSENITLSTSFLGPSQVVVTVAPSIIAATPLMSGNASLTITVPSTVSPGDYVLNVTGTTINLHHTIQVPVWIVSYIGRQGFFLSAYPSYLTMSPNSNGSSLLTINSFNLTGTVTLLAEFNHSGLLATPSPGNFSLTPGSHAYSTLSVTTTTHAAPGFYLLNVTGFASTGHYSTTITVQVTMPVNGPDFTISANPQSTGVTAGTSAFSTLKLTSLNNFSGKIALWVNSVYCASLSCPRATLNPENVTLTSNGTATSTLIFYATTIGTYDVTVNATNSGIAHSITIEFNINAGFTLAAPENLSIRAGESETVLVVISPGIGFSSLVNLTATASDGVTAQLSQNSITTSGSVHLTITTHSGIAPGSYAVTLKAVSGSQVQTKVIALTVTAPVPATKASSNLIMGLDPELFYAIIATIVAVGITTAFLILRTRMSIRPSS